MRWRNLLFMHWPVPEEALRPLIPPALKLDTFDGESLFFTWMYRIVTNRCLSTLRRRPRSLRPRLPPRTSSA